MGLIELQSQVVFFVDVHTWHTGAHQKELFVQRHNGFKHWKQSNGKVKVWQRIAGFRLQQSGAHITRRCLSGTTGPGKLFVLQDSKDLFA